MSENESEIPKINMKVNGVDVSEDKAILLKAVMEGKINAENILTDERKKQIELDAIKNSKESGKGSIPNSFNEINRNFTPKMEFEGETMVEAHENMLQWCKLNDKKAYDALKKKTLEAVAENKGFSEVRDYFDSEGRSCIGRALHRNNISKRPEKEI